MKNIAILSLSNHYAGKNHSPFDLHRVTNNKKLNQRHTKFVEIVILKLSDLSY
jgi:hypothetical protein